MVKVVWSAFDNMQQMQKADNIFRMKMYLQVITQVNMQIVTSRI